MDSQDKVEKSRHYVTQRQIILNDAAEINFEELRATVISALLEN